jgi:hypothetical protein
MPLPRGASQAAVGAGCAGDWQKRQAKRGGTHAACAPVEGACERRSRVHCGADRSLGEWQRLWIGSNVGWGVVSCRRRFARWNPKRADPSARALFLLEILLTPLYRLPNQTSRKTAIDDPLLQVPPTSRGNRTRAPCTVPRAKQRGTEPLYGSPREAAHSTTVSGRTGSEADFAPLLQVPPAGGGNQTAVPLAKQGEPNGGGLQKVSCNEREAGGTSRRGVIGQLCSRNWYDQGAGETSRNPFPQSESCTHNGARSEPRTDGGVHSAH